MSTAWMADGLCLTHPDPDLWVPDGRGRGGAAAYALAREVCGQCPVQAPCLAFALANEQKTDARAGMYGGLTPDERTALANAQKKKASA